LLGSTYFFVQTKLIATIYERLVKAKQLITCESLALSPDKTYAVERFNMFVGLYLSLLSQQSRFENTQHEDILRLLMGKEAYLLFVFDKLVTSVSLSLSDSLYRPSKVCQTCFNLKIAKQRSVFSRNLQAKRPPPSTFTSRTSTPNFVSCPFPQAVPCACFTATKHVS
jgi:histone deacetylase complex regulatory component SIN3